MAAGILRALQGGLETMYRVDSALDIRDFLVEDERRDQLAPERRPKEQLLLRQEGDDLEIGLYVDERTLVHLTNHDPRHRLDDRNLPDFLLAVEGVSHFVYLSYRARQERPISAVELELQAEIDKYLVVLLVAWKQDGTPPVGLRERLFEHIQFHGDLSEEERERYWLANQAADRYAESLEERYVQPRSLESLLAEVRGFYRKGLVEKLDYIEKLAA